MTVTPSSERETLTTDVVVADLQEEDASLDLAIPEDVPSADDSSSRVAARDGDGVGFTIDDFAALLSKYDYNFKPGDDRHRRQNRRLHAAAGGVDQPG